MLFDNSGSRLDESDMLRLRATPSALLHELASAAPAALAFGLLLRKILPARVPAARIGGAFADVFGEFGQGVGHGWSSCPQATQPDSRRPARDAVRRVSP